MRNLLHEMKIDGNDKLSNLNEDYLEGFTY